MFNRAEVWNPPLPEPDDWPQNLLIVLAVATAVMGFGSRISVGRCVQFGAAWLLAFAWLYFRRRSLLAAKPWLALWLVPVAMGTSDFLSDAAGVNVARFFALAIAAGAMGFGMFRAPRSAGATLLYALAVVLACLGLGFLVIAALGACGLMDGGEWNLLGVVAPSGGWGDLVGGGTGLLMVGLGVAARQLARRLGAGGDAS